MPDQPGLAVGCGRLAFGLGMAGSASFFNYLLSHLTCVQALNIAALILTLSTLALSPIVKWPSACEVPGPRKEELVIPLQQVEHEELCLAQEVKISWQRLILLPPL